MTVDLEENLLPPEHVIAEAVAAGLGRAELISAEVTLAWRQTVLRKQIVEYRVRDNAARDISIIGKVYVRAERGAAAFALLRYLAGAMGDPEFAVTTPVAWLPEWRMLLMRKAPGRILSEQLLGDPGDLEAPRLAGRWLRALHGVPAPGFLPDTEVRAVAGVARFDTELSRVLPRAMQERLATLLRRIALGVPQPADGHQVLLHGDFHPRNVFIGEEPGKARVTAIDVDHARLGDPAWDVGYLMGQMRELARDRMGDLRALEAPAAAFCREYVDLLPPVEQAAFVRRAAWFEALTLVESLHYRRCILRLPVEPGDASVLAAGARALDVAA